MSHPENACPPACVPVSTAGTPESDNETHGAPSTTQDVVSPAGLVISPPPQSVSPSEWVAAEATLLLMLKRHYGWIQPEPHTLVRYRRAS